MEVSFSNSNQSGKRRTSFAYILAVALGYYVITDLHAQVIVAPNAMTSVDGNTSLFSPAGSGPGALRAIAIYEASQFGSLAGPSWLTQIARRADILPGALGPRTQVLKVYASTTSRSSATLSTTFSQNVGTNNTLVFDGTITTATENLPGPGDTRQFDIMTKFTTPFLYDPAAGNLSLDFQYFSDNGQDLRWDAVTSIQSVIAGDSATALTGSFIQKSPVYQFTFAAPSLATIRTSQVEVCWNSQSNIVYQVQYHSELTPNDWISLGECIRSTNTTTCISDPIIVGQPQRFYRVVLSNCIP